MIPKIIHFCWLSNDPYPDKIKRCIDSWSRVLPDYEIWLWDLNRLGDAANGWVREAFSARKYAFAADFVRAYALYNYGGIYLDSDVEVLKPFDSLLDFPYFFCRESGGWVVEAACMGAEKGLPLFKLLLDYYADRHFIAPDGSLDMKPMPTIMHHIIHNRYDVHLIESPAEFNREPRALSVLPSDYFSPIDTCTMAVGITDRTIAVHHFAGTWCSPSMRLRKRMQRLLGVRITKAIIRAKRVLSPQACESQLK